MHCQQRLSSRALYITDNDRRIICKDCCLAGTAATVIATIVLIAFRFRTLSLTSQICYNRRSLEAMPQGLTHNSVIFAFGNIRIYIKIKNASSPVKQILHALGLYSQFAKRADCSQSLRVAFGVIVSCTFVRVRVEMPNGRNA